MVLASLSDGAADQSWQLKKASIAEGLNIIAGPDGASRSILA